MRFGARLLGLLLLLVAINTVDARQAGQRLQRTTQYGGLTQTAVFDGVDALVAEGTSIVRVPLLGPDAFQVIDRRTFDYGIILDLYRTNQALYAITHSHLLVLSPDGRHVWNVFTGGGERLTIWDKKLAVSNYQSGVSLYTIEATGDLHFVQQITTPSQTQQVALLPTNLLAMADQSAGLRLVGTTDINVVLAPAHNVTNFAEWIYTSAGHRLRLVDSATEPPHIAGHYAPIHDIRDLAFYRDMVLVADGADGLKVYRDDLSYLNSQLDSSAYHVTVGSDAIISTHQDGLHIYNGQMLPRLQQIGFIPLWEQPTGLDLSADLQYALVALGPGGLAIVDMSMFTVQAAIPLSGPVQDVLAHPDYPTLFYLSLSDGRLITMDIDQQRIYSDLPLPGQPGKMATDGDYLTVATGRAGLQIFSLQHAPTQPQLIFTLPTINDHLPGITHAVPTDQDHWLVLDDTTARIMRLRDFHETNRYHHLTASALVSTPIGFIAGQDNQLLHFTLDATHDLHVQSKITAPQKYLDMRALLGRLVLATDDRRLLVLDVSDPTTPREYVSIETPFPVERLTIRGDDFLLINRTEGMAHLHWTLLLGPEAQAELTGIYRPAQSIQALVPLTNGKIGLGGGRWFVWDGGEPTLLNNEGGTSGIAFDDSAILLRKDHTPFWPDGLANPNVVGMALATDQQRMWLLRHDGLLQQLDPVTLNVLNTSKLPITQPSAMIFYDNALWIGTHDGKLWQIIDDDINLMVEDLGGPIRQITPFQHYLYISADAGGLWQMTVDGQPLRHYPSIALATAIEGEWIALAGGDCGLQILKAPELHNYAELAGNYVNAVQFVEDGVLALADGIPTHYAFLPTQAAPPMPRAYHPVPPHQAEASPQLLQWQLDRPTCRPLRFEIWLNGEMVGTTSQTEWTLSTPPTSSLKWQVVTVDSTGNRIAGPEWSVYPPTTGWLNTPSHVSNSATVPPNTIPSPWWALGLLLAGMGLLGLANMVRRQLKRQY